MKKFDCSNEIGSDDYFLPNAELRRAHQDRIVKCIQLGYRNGDESYFH